MMRWIPLVVALLGAVAAAFTPQAREWVVNNPEWAAIIAGIAAALNAILKSPLDGPK